ncbi:MobC family plasmid mobilization relaxosome protein [Desulfovibrio sp. OttesenSCG-928-G11]|nr:MobC family plasmid mobilization relaxosome protein [Desulfovibrio sp. OttesenSCG-928-G11]
MGKRHRICTARIELRCSHEELSRWRLTATEQGIPLSRLIRACLNQGAISVKRRQADPALLRQLAAIGNNLNQISHWANTFKEMQEARPVEEGVMLVRGQLAALLERESGNADQGV